MLVLVPNIRLSFCAPFSKMWLYLLTEIILPKIESEEKQFFNYLFFIC